VEFVRDNLGKPVPEETFTHPHSSWLSIIPICFLHLLRSIACSNCSIFNPRALQSFSTISLQVFFGLPLGLVPSTSYSIHFFTQSLSSFCSTCPYHRNLFRCSGGDDDDYYYYYYYYYYANHFTVPLDCVRDYLGEPVLER